MTRMQLAIIAASLGGISTSPCQAQNNTPNAPWYLGVNAGISVQESQPETDEGTVVSLVLGRNRHATSSWEVELWRDEHSLTEDQDLKQLGIGFNWLQINREPLWDPYFLMSVGALRTDLNALSSTDVALSVAIGGSWGLGDSGLQMIADLRYRYTLYDDALDDLIDRGEPQLMLGLRLPLWFGVR